MAKTKTTKSSHTSKAAKKPAAAAKKPTKTAKKAVKTASAKTAKKTAKISPPRTAKKTVATGIKKRVVKTVAQKKKAPAKKASKPLSSREARIQQIRLSLLQQREALLSEAESALNALPGQTIFPDLGDQATAETDRNFMLRLRGREQRLLKKIDEAVDRIDRGVFGICDDCGNEIDIKRLEARPVTTMCIECKTLQEEEERLRET
jgi:DnaK suppressor protein